jgi:hypothetical protein
MAMTVHVRNPNTKKVEKHTPTNANDLIQHLGWKLVKVEDDGKTRDESDIQKIIDRSASMPAAVRNSGGSERADDDADEDADKE